MIIAWTAVAVCLGAGAELQLRAEAEVAGDIVRLADVAEPAAKWSAASPAWGELREIDVADAPAVGHAAAVTRRLIELRLRLAGYTPADVRLSGSRQCLVRRVVPLSLKERLEQRLVAEYATAWSVPAEDLHVRVISAVRPPDNDPLAEVRVTLGRDPRAGPQRAALELVSRQGTRRVQQASHVVSRRYQVPLADRDLRPGQLLQPQDVRWESRMRADAAPDWTRDQLIGQVAVRPVRLGDELTSGDLRPASAVTMVRRRAAVECVARKGPLKITLPGAIAVTEGAYGEMVRLKNPFSGREFTGVVDGPGLVRVVLP